MRFETRAIRDGQAPDPKTGAVVVPVYQTSTFQQDGIGRNRGFEYTRSGNPTRKALEEALASLESGRHGLAFASGSAAMAAVLHTLRPGDHVVAGEDLYGGTIRMFERIYRPWGLDFSYAKVEDPADFAAKMRPATKLVWVESPTNPLLRIADLAAVAEAAHRGGAKLVVDNTFATPLFQRPLELGADIIVHSATKYLGGHSDVIGGAIVVRDDALFESLRFVQNGMGGVPAPWDCWLVLRGLRTLAVRMREHDRNARHLAQVLEKHPRIARVHHPALASHPQRALAARQMEGFGGTFSVEFAGDFASIERFLSRLKVFLLAESLGGVESLICYPPRMSHGALTPEERHARGIRETLLRISVGIENVKDLEEDLLGALSE
ncbi:MAG: PLP-dependent transferase [Lentisphaerae bacterium]|nr:PLP-dependent transferase [Lentisphaerota bacterium]